MASPKSCLGTLAAALLCACGGASTPATPSATTETPASPSSSGQPCDVRASSGAGRVPDQNGPYFHQTVIARLDSSHTIRDPVQVLDHASVPDGVRASDGSTLVYYVNGEEGSTWVARLTGTTAAPLGPIVLNGVPRPQGVVDPDATAIGGRIRLAYLSGFGAPGSAQPRGMCLAESTDGVNFTVIATALTLGTSSTDTDPSIVQLRDGSWLMAISRGQQTVMARSGDGLTFSIYATLSYGGVPEVALASDGRVRLYVCARGIESYVSADSGASWQHEGVVVPSGTLGKRIVCDPSYVAGTDLFIFKTG